MKKIAASLLLVLSTSLITAQKPYLQKADGQTCLPEGITFSTQAQIDSFQINYPGCTEIEGDVTIWGEDLSNLEGLIDITSIGVHLYFGMIMNNIYPNPLLTTLSGLDNLTSIGGYLHIYGNSGLMNMAGLENLTSIGGGCYIWANDGLADFTGMENLNCIGGSMEILQNDALSSFDGLEELTTLSGEMRIYGNPVLTDLTGLGNIQASTIDSIRIINNPSLSNCNIDCICDYLSAPNGCIEVYNNDPGCNTIFEVADGSTRTAQFERKPLVGLFLVAHASTDTNTEIKPFFNFFHGKSFVQFDDFFFWGHMRHPPSLNLDKMGILTGCSHRKWFVASTMISEVKSTNLWK